MANRLVIPGILTDSLQDLKEKVHLVHDQVVRVSVDVIDGVFADNVTVGVEDLRDVEWGNVKFDVQLMVEEPEDWLGQCFSVGADRVFGHIEKMGDTQRFAAVAKEYSFSLGWG